MTEAQGASSFSAGAGVFGSVTRRGGGGAETICAPPNRPAEKGGMGLSQPVWVLGAGSAGSCVSAVILALQPVLKMRIDIGPVTPRARTAVQGSAVLQYSSVMRAS